LTKILKKKEKEQKSNYIQEFFGVVKLL
jgi:hypothetical protein